MSFIDQSVDNGVEKYMELIQKIDHLIDEAEEKNPPAENANELDERVEDLNAIRQEFVKDVVNNGINKDIIDKTSRMLSVF
jgi:FixJ family two-component response regulator